MRLLIPTVDNEAEHVFYLTQAEILARCTPVVDAVVAAQTAVLADDPAGLAAALEQIGPALDSVVRRWLPKISPVARAATYVDPVWAKTVAPFAVPFDRSTAGPSGTSSPIFTFSTRSSAARGTGPGGRRTGDRSAGCSIPAGPGSSKRVPARTPRRCSAGSVTTRAGGWPNLPGGTRSAASNRCPMVLCSVRGSRRYTRWSR
jgi:hypothetical protein